MEEQKTHFRYVILYCYHKDKKRCADLKKIYAVYGEDSVNDRMCQF